MKEIVLLRMPRMPRAFVSAIYQAKSRDELLNVLQVFLEKEEVKEALHLTNSAFARALYQNFPSDLKDYLASAIKYLLRMSYRSTPVGAYAGVAELATSDRSDFFEQEKIIYEYYAEKSIKSIEQGLIDFSKVTFQLNSTAVFFKDEVSYIARSAHGAELTFNKRTQKLTPAMLALLELCRQPKAERELIKKNQADVIRNYLLYFYKINLLEVDWAPSQIGSSFKQDESLLRQTVASENIHLDTKITLSNNSIDIKKLNEISLVGKTLAEISVFRGNRESPWFEEIKEYFSEHNGESSVSLYDFISQCSLFFKDSKVCTRSKKFKGVEEAQELWKNIFNNALINNDDYVDLKMHLKSFSQIQTENAPRVFYDLNTITVLGDFSSYSKFSFNWKGCKILSRFLYLYDDKSIRSEEKNYLEVDVEYTPHSKSNSVIKRPEYFSHYIRLGHAKSNKRKYLELEDLHLCMINNELVLFSKNLKKRVIPVLVTAYDFLNDPHPIVRFLFNLGNQNTADAIDLRTDFFQDNNIFTPGVTLNGQIVKAKSWKLTRGQFIKMLSSSELRSRYSMPDHVLWIVSDKYIPLDLGRPELCEMLLAKETGDIYLEEDWISLHGKSIRSSNNEYNHEISFNAEINKDIRKPLKFFPESTNFIYPNEGVLNLHLSLPKHRHQAFLQDVVEPFLKSKKSLKFYYIRYGYPTDELRLRFFGKLNPNDIFTVIKKNEKKYLINKSQMLPLEKELTTYGGEIGLKNYFAISQKLSMFHIKYNVNNPILYLLSFIEELNNDPCFKSLKVDETFSPLHNLTSSQINEFKKEITVIWNQLKSAQIAEEKVGLKKIIGPELKKLSENFKTKKIKVSKEYFFRRLIHMEVFRLSAGHLPYLEVGAYDLYIKKELAKKFKKGKL